MVAGKFPAVFIFRECFDLPSPKKNISSSHLLIELCLHFGAGCGIL